MKDLQSELDRQKARVVVLEMQLQDAQEVILALVHSAVNVCQVAAEHGEGSYAQKVAEFFKREQ